MKLRSLRIKHGHFEKRCSDCKQWLTLDAYNGNISSITGFQHGCRECQALRKRYEWERNRQRNAQRRQQFHDALAETITPEKVEEYKAWLKRRDNG